MTDSDRIIELRTGIDHPTGVVYWMRREFRHADNRALHHAMAAAADIGHPLIVAVHPYTEMNDRQRHFLKAWIPELGRRLKDMGIPLFFDEAAEPGQFVARIMRDADANMLVTDFDPLRHARCALEHFIRKAPHATIREVDGRNVVPARLVSHKAEVGARTLRPKLHHLLSQFLEPAPAPRTPPAWTGEYPAHDFPADAASGYDAGMARLASFIEDGLPRYVDDRSDPLKSADSRLSPYLHFGMISAQTAARHVMAADAPREAVDAFIEQLVVRRELSDNFCLYQPEYDNPKGYPEWARQSHERHLPDDRDYFYSPGELERSETHDPLWNACMTEMVKTGYLHNHLRMYWAKQVLAWSRSAKAAHRAAQQLNDRYCLDGWDTNGFTGVAWAVGGVHDRPWPEREVFGVVRSMTLSGARRKFDVDAYVERINALP